MHYEQDANDRAQNQQVIGKALMHRLRPGAPVATGEVTAIKALSKAIPFRTTK